MLIVTFGDVVVAVPFRSDDARSVSACRAIDAAISRCGRRVANGRVARSDSSERGTSRSSSRCRRGRSNRSRACASVGLSDASGCASSGVGAATSRGGTIKRSTGRSGDRAASEARTLDTGGSTTCACRATAASTTLASGSSDVGRRRSVGRTNDWARVSVGCSTGSCTSSCDSAARSECASSTSAATPGADATGSNKDAGRGPTTGIRSCARAITFDRKSLRPPASIVLMRGRARDRAAAASGSARARRLRSTCTRARARGRRAACGAPTRRSRARDRS